MTLLIVHVYLCYTYNNIQILLYSDTIYTIYLYTIYSIYYMLYGYYYMYTQWVYVTYYTCINSYKIIDKDVLG